MKTFEKYSDAIIIQRILSGEFALFEILIRRNNSFLYKIGRSYNYNHEDVQDLMQDTYIDAFTNLSKFENRSSFKTWIIKIMLHNCFRKQQKWNFKNISTAEIKEKSTPMFSNNHQTDTNRTVLNKELNLIIETALQNIPINHRMVFILREVNGLNITETANALDISESNVKVRLNRAKALLRKEVEKSYTPEDIFEFNLIHCDSMVHRVMRELAKINAKDPQ